MNVSRVILWGMAAMLSAHAASASSINTYNRDAFQTALAANNLSGQNFDSLPLGTITTVNGVTYKPSAGTALVTSTFLTTTNPNGLGSTSAGYFGPAESLTILFSAPITAFALDINSFANHDGDYVVVANDGSASVVKSLYDVFPNNATGQFIGFTDSASFSSITLSSLFDSAAGRQFSYTVDTLVYGQATALAVSATPEPGSLWMLGTGVLGIAGLVRRRMA